MLFTVGFFIRNFHFDCIFDFFNGFEYRTDILHKIDDEVLRICQALFYGQRVTLAERKLTVLALYGNVADVYRFYEYNYQTEWLHHRYMPEHVVLQEIPKDVCKASFPSFACHWADEVMMAVKLYATCTTADRRYQGGR